MNEPELQRAIGEIAGIRAWFDVDMARHCTLRTGGRARVLAEVAHERALAKLLALLPGTGIPWRVIGRGSNILVQDQGFPGVLIRLDQDLAGIRSLGHGRVRVGGGSPLAGLLGDCRRQGWAGLEFLAGVPGSVGGALAMNAGAFGREIMALVEALRVLAPGGRCRIWRAGEFTAEYRRLVLPDPGEQVILEAELSLIPADPAEVARTMDGYLAKRRESQPRAAGSAGSFFKNPPGQYAGRLIEEAGLKGVRIGGAMVSPVHANFIVNTGDATATDILDLMRLVQEKVRARTAILLEPEVHIL